MTEIERPPADKLDNYNNPVLHCNKGDTVWHIPYIEGGLLRFLCFRHEGESSIKISEYEVFLRRRNPRKCKICEERAQTSDRDGIKVQAND